MYAIRSYYVQFLVHDNHVYVIELNIRASRSMPFVSKLVKLNLISLAAKAILDKPLPKVPKNKWQKIPNYGIKVPQFSFMQLEGADIALGVEMQSTGEARITSYNVCYTKLLRYLELKLFDAKTGNTIQHTSFFVTVDKEGELLMRNLFHTHSGDLIIKIQPTDLSVNDVIVYGDHA